MRRRSARTSALLVLRARGHVGVGGVEGDGLDPGRGRGPSRGARGSRPRTGRSGRRRSCGRRPAGRRGPLPGRRCWGSWGRRSAGRRWRRGTGRPGPGRRTRSIPSPTSRPAAAERRPGSRAGSSFSQWKEVAARPRSRNRPARGRSAVSNGASTTWKRRRRRAGAQVGRQPRVGLDGHHRVRSGGQQAAGGDEPVPAPTSNTARPGPQPAPLRARSHRPSPDSPDGWRHSSPHPRQTPGGRTRGRFRPSADALFGRLMDPGSVGRP